MTNYVHAEAMKVIGGLCEGFFAYPFRYQLPHGLPGVFHAKYEDTRNGRTWQGVVKYVIGALIEVSDAPPEHKLFGEIPLVVLDSIECAQSNPATRKLETVSAVGSVRTFFCIHRGDIKVMSSLDKMAYTPEDKVVVQLQLENTSAVDVPGSTLKVILTYAPASFICTFTGHKNY